MQVEQRLNTIPGMKNLIDEEYSKLILIDKIKTEEIVDFINYRGQHVRIVKTENYDIFVDDTHPQTNCTAEDCIRWLAFSSHQE